MLNNSVIAKSRQIFLLKNNSTWFSTTFFRPPLIQLPIKAAKMQNNASSNYETKLTPYKVKSSNQHKWKKVERIFQIAHKNHTIWSYDNLIYTSETRVSVGRRISGTQIAALNERVWLACCMQHVLAHGNATK